jgi:hypothetical protein
MPKYTVKFRKWMRQLEEDVIQAEYGFEPGEFSVFPSHWRPMYVKGLTPNAAFRKALDALAADREQKDRERKERWSAIQASDARAISMENST